MPSAAAVTRPTIVRVMGSINMPHVRTATASPAPARSQSMLYVNV